MNSPNFNDVLDRPSDSIEKPKPLPVGHYLAAVKGQGELGHSKEKKTPQVEYTLQLLQAAEDVDQEALAEVLKGKAISEKTVKATFYLTEDAIWRLKEFLDHCGIEGGTATLRERMMAAPGCQVLISIRHEPSKDGSNIFARFDGSAAMPT